MHQCMKFILFWNEAVHVSGSLSVYHQEFKTIHTATKQLASRQQDLFGCCVYSLELLMISEKTVRNM